MATIGAKIDMLDPTAGPVSGMGTLSPRLESLDGKTIGVIWNGRPAGELVLKGILQRLEARHRIKVVFRGKPNIGNIAPAQILDELGASCDGVITGVGD